MEPLAALGVAAAVVQFLDFGVRILAKAKDIYGSASGTDARHVDIRVITENLTGLTRRLSTESPAARPVTASEDERALYNMTERCSEIGHRLLAALEAARVKGNHRAWKSVRQALKSSLGHDPVEGLYIQLRQYREQVVVLLLVIISAKQATTAKAMDNLAYSIQGTESSIVSQIQKGQAKVLQAIVKTKYRANRPQDVAHVSEMLSEYTSSHSEKRRRDAILHKLYYPRMQDRREQISKAHAETFNWVLQDDAGETASWPDLKEWLKHGEGIYWLSGKAGSGKSTLIKYIDQDPRTFYFLEDWARPLPVVTANFYFWSPGLSMQKSQLGLLQCLLYEVLKQRPSIIPWLLPHRWGDEDQSTDAMTAEWTLSELSDAFVRLATANSNNKYCFIIDGLDEFDGDQQSLLDLMSSMTQSTNIKILASSRPELIFRDAFADAPHLVLQDLTFNDIYSFVQETLGTDQKFKKLSHLEPQRSQEILNEIVERASGVFLWVFLVVRSLREGMRDGDRVTELQTRLRNLPTDLEDYFAHTLNGLNPRYLQQASRYFRLALEAREPLSLLSFSFLDEEDPEFVFKMPTAPLSEEARLARFEFMERRLSSRCKGFHEIVKPNTPSGSSSGDDQRVNFLHRTVRDFLHTPGIHVKLVAVDSPEFDAHLALSKAFVAQLKCLHNTGAADFNFSPLWDQVSEALYHASRVSGNVRTEDHIALLNELDRAAANYRLALTSKRASDTAAHWANTGFAFGLHHTWNNNFLTLCLQCGLTAYADHALGSANQLDRPGKPYLAFALYGLARQSNQPDKASLYRDPQLSIVHLLLQRGASPNDLDDRRTIWSRFLFTLYYMCNKGSWRQESLTWFKVAKMLVLHGADPELRCPLGVENDGPLALRPQDITNLQSFKDGAAARARAVPNTKTALEILSGAFESCPGCDINDLTDLLEQSARKGRLQPRGSPGPRPRAQSKDGHPSPLSILQQPSQSNLVETGMKNHQNGLSSQTMKQTSPSASKYDIPQTLETTEAQGKKHRFSRSRFRKWLGVS